MFPECMTLSAIFMALLASCGGCIIKYSELYKRKSLFKIGFLAGDLLTAALTGFFLTWFLLDQTDLEMSHVMMVLMLTGFLGSKILDIGSYILYKKLGIQAKFNKGVIEDGISEQRPQKSQSGQSQTR